MDVEEGEYGDGFRVKRIRQVHLQSDLSQALWSIILRKEELKRYDPREAGNFRRCFRIAYEFFLKLMKLANQVVLIGCKERGREAEHTSGAEDQYKLLPILSKTCKSWVGDDSRIQTV